MPNNSKSQKPPKGCKSYIFTGLFVLILFLLTLTLLGILAPGIFLVVINMLWLLLLVLVLVFVALGILVMIGLKKEAMRLIDIIFEGSLTLIDIADFLKEAYKSFLKYLREFMLLVIPVFAIFMAIVLYLLLLYSYKWVGRDNDVTIFTAIITSVMIFFIGILSRPTNKPKTVNWFTRAKDKFSHTFKDGLEVMIFVFFLTMDSTRIFFLPKELNIELHAEVFNYNLMHRGIAIDEYFMVTLTLVMFAIGIEILRNIIKVIALAVNNYQVATTYLLEKGKEYRTAELMKISLRQSMNSSMDELIKFITFTTLLIMVFLLFPRLKIFTMVVASMTALILDILIRSRLKVEKGNDIISRIITKIFKL
jgi:hypothetical protein